MRKNWLILWCNSLPRVMMLRTGIGWAVAISACGLLTGACGYQFSVEGVGPTIGGGKRTLSQGETPVRIAVQDFSNNTFHPNIESQYADFVRQELATTGGAVVVPDQTKSEFVMKGEVVSVQIPSLAFSNTRTQESRVTVTVRVTVENRQTGAIVWSQSAVGSGDFFVGGSPDSGGGGASLQFNQVLQDRALEQAGQRVAENLAAEFNAARAQGLFSVMPSNDSLKNPSPSRGPAQ